MKLEDLPQRDGRREKSGAINVQFQCKCGRWTYVIHRVDEETLVCGHCFSRILRKRHDEKRNAREASVE